MNGLIRPQTNTGSTVYGIPVRVLIQESHDISAKISQYATENAKSVADHVVLNPNSVEVEFAMSNTEGGSEQALDVFAAFTKLLDKRTPNTLETEHGRYKNMVITSFRPIHRAPFRGAFTATIRLEQAGIIGTTDSVERKGGRPADILEPGVTSKTACQYQYAGEVGPVASGAVYAASLEKVGKGAA